PSDAGADNIYNVTVITTDTQGGTDSQALAITVTNVDEAPVAAVDSGVATEAGAATTGNVLTNDVAEGVSSVTNVVDDDGDVITVGTPFITDNGGSLTINSDGSYSYTPPPQGSVPALGLSETFTYTVTDGDGDTGQSTLTIVVANNDQPAIAVADNAIATEGGISESGNVLSNDTIEDGPGSVTAIIDGNGDAIGVGVPFITDGGATITVNSDGSYTYTPPAQGAVPPGGLTETFTYTVTDADGDTSQAILSVMVADNDLVPIVVNDTATATEGATAATGNILSNDTIGDGPATVSSALDDDGDVITVGTPFITDNGGSLTINGDGSYSYTPPAQGTVPPAGLTEVFTFTVTDADGDSIQSTLTIAVANNDISPIANADAVTATEAGSSQTGNVLTNDISGDGSSTVIGLVNSSGDAIPVGSTFTTNAGATLTLNADGSYSYTPPAQGNVPAAGLTEVFTYTVSDADGDTDQATLTISVTDNDVFPIVTVDVNTAQEGGAAVNGNVLTNDTILDGPGSVTAAVDDGGDIITIGVPFATDSGGILTVNSNGTYTYTPPALGVVPFTGLTEVFTLTISDVDGDNVQSTLTLNVLNTDANIIARDDTVTRIEGGGSQLGDIFLNDIVPDQPPSVVSVVDENGNSVTLGSEFTTDNGGKLTVNEDGTFSYQPPVQGGVPVAGLSEVFTIRVSDADGDLSQSTLTFIVRDNGVNTDQTVPSNDNQNQSPPPPPTTNVNTNIDFTPAVDDPTSVTQNIDFTTVLSNVINQPIQNADILDLPEQDGFINLTGNLQDQILGSGESVFPIANAFQHTDPSETLIITATLEDGSPLPDYIRYDESSQQFILDADMANALGIESETVLVTAEDSRGNSTNARFNVFSVENAGATNAQALSNLGPGGIISLIGDLQDQILGTGSNVYPVADAFLHTDPAEVLTITARLENGDELPGFIQFDANNQEFVLDADAAAEAGIEEGIVVVVTAEDSQGNAATSKFTVYDADSAPAAGAVDPVTGNTVDATPVSTSVITLVSRIQDQAIPTNIPMIVFSIVDNFQHTDPMETLTITATLEDGSPLPNYILFDQENREFIIDADMARILGIDEVVIVVEAEDSKGNSVSSRFRVQVDSAEVEIDESEVDADAETVMESAEPGSESEDNAPLDQELALTSEWKSLELVAQGDAELLDLLNSLTNQDGELDQELKDFAKENLNDQILRAGEFGYQQEKLELKTLLEKIFSRG
ncbi:MAG: hypothetical protein COA71_10105, partial [SAR86 cluster bacterium]